METTASTKWGFDPTHTEISFRVKHLMITNVKGFFKQFEGSVETHGDDFSTAKINFSVRIDSIETGEPNRDAHLKSADFFDAENYPVMEFVSEKMEKVSDDEYTLNGTLTIRGTSKPITLKAEYGGLVKDPWGNMKAGFTLTGKLNRKEFGLLWNVALETGGVLVGEDVNINCDVELAKLAL
jgi:polyisoprenoid-binding protein YceI